jgi:hypothetical protein
MKILSQFKAGMLLYSVRMPKAQALIFLVALPSLWYGLHPMAQDNHTRTKASGKKKRGGTIPCTLRHNSEDGLCGTYL